MEWLILAALAALIFGSRSSATANAAGLPPPAPGGAPPAPLPPLWSGATPATPGTTTTTTPGPLPPLWTGGTPATPGASSGDAAQLVAQLLANPSAAAALVTNLSGVLAADPATAGRLIQSAPALAALLPQLAGNPPGAAALIAGNPAARAELERVLASSPQLAALARTVLQRAPGAGDPAGVPPVLPASADAAQLVGRLWADAGALERWCQNAMRFALESAASTALATIAPTINAALRLAPAQAAATIRGSSAASIEMARLIDASSTWAAAARAALTAPPPAPVAPSIPAPPGMGPSITQANANNDARRAALMEAQGAARGIVGALALGEIRRGVYSRALEGWQRTMGEVVADGRIGPATARRVNALLGRVEIDPDTLATPLRSVPQVHMTAPPPGGADPWSPEMQAAEWVYARTRAGDVPRPGRSTPLSDAMAARQRTLRVPESRVLDEWTTEAVNRTLGYVAIDPTTMQARVFS